MLNKKNANSVIPCLPLIVRGGDRDSGGRGLLHFVMQHWRHKSQSRNVGSFSRKELGDSLEEHRIFVNSFMSHIRPLRGLSFSTKSLLSSVA